MLAWICDVCIGFNGLFGVDGFRPYCTRFLFRLYSLGRVGDPCIVGERVRECGLGCAGLQAVGEVHAGIGPWHLSAVEASVPEEGGHRPGAHWSASDSRLAAQV